MEIVKILVERVPKDPKECPFYKSYCIGDWDRADCTLLHNAYNTSGRYFADERVRNIVEKRVSCRLIYGEACPYLKTV